MPDLSKVYSAIGAALTDEEIDQLVEKAGKQPSDIFGQNDTRKEKIRKTIEKLKKEGNERWLLTYVLIQAAEHADVRQAIVQAFPTTLIRLPLAEQGVMAASEYLRKVLIPVPPGLKIELLPKRRSFSDIMQSIVTLFAYKSLHEYLLRLLFILNVNEALLANAAQGVAPDLDSVVHQMDQVVGQAPAVVACVGAGASQEDLWVTKLRSFSASLQAVLNTPEKARDIINEVQRLVRQNLLRLNGKIFVAVQELSFDALTGNFPETIEERNEFKELVQAIFDLRATVLARAFKNKMWQDAENQMSLISGYFDAPTNATSMIEDWLALRSRVNWLAELEPDEQWANEARKYATEIDEDLSKEEELDDQIRVHFETYRSWFRGPFTKIDDTLKLDCGALCKMDDPLKTILDALTK